MTPEAVLTLVLALFGVVLATASLIWQFASWRLSGARVRVDLLLGAMGAGGAMTLPVAGWRSRIPDQFDAAGYRNPRVFIEVRNVGRSAVNVERFSLPGPEGIVYFKAGTELWEPPLPFRLEPGASQTWSYDMGEVLVTMRGLKHLGKEPTFRASASMGDGKTRLSQAEVRLSDLEP